VAEYPLCPPYKRTGEAVVTQQSWWCSASNVQQSRRNVPLLRTAVSIEKLMVRVVYVFRVGRRTTKCRPSTPCSRRGVIRPRPGPEVFYRQGEEGCRQPRVAVGETMSSAVAMSPLAYATARCVARGVPVPAKYEREMVVVGKHAFYRHIASRCCLQQARNQHRQRHGNIRLSAGDAGGSRWRLINAAMMPTQMRRRREEAAGRWNVRP